MQIILLLLFGKTVLFENKEFLVISKTLHVA